MSPKLLIVRCAEGPSTPKKLKQAGADHIVMPAAIGGPPNRISSDRSGRGRVAELVTNRSSVAIEIDKLLISPTSTLAGQSLRQADIKRRTEVIVIAIKRADGRVEFPPSGDGILAGDSIVMMASENLRQFRENFHVSDQARSAKITASRTGNSCGLSCGRTSSVRPFGVAGQEAGISENGLEIGPVLFRGGQAEQDRPRLAQLAAAVHIDENVDPPAHVGQLERRLHVRLLDLERKIHVIVLAVDQELTRALANANASNRRLPPAGAPRERILRRRRHVSMFPGKNARPAEPRRLMNSMNV